MKFDYIIGNPPYQSPTSRAGRGSNKLYFKITDKMIHLMKHQLYFVCPKSILVRSSMNTAFEVIKKNTSRVEDAKDFFKESTEPVSFLVNSKAQTSLMYNNNPIKQIEHIYSTEEYWNFYELVSTRYNKRKKLKIRPSHSPIGYKASEITDEETPFELLHQSNGEEGCTGPAGRKIRYLKSPRDAPKKKLIVAYSSKWFDPFFTDLYLSEFFGVVDESYNLENVKTYLETETIKNFVVNYSLTTGGSYYNALWQLPEVDFSHPWDDESLRKELKVP